MSIYDKDLLTGRDKVQTAIERIRTYCSGKRVLCAFSGGKDSQVCYHLCKEAGIDFTAQYSVTRFEPPELMQFILAHYPDVKFRRAYKRSLIADIEKRGLPTRWLRWCCDCKHQKTDGYDIVVVGVRWAESARRRMRWTMFGVAENRSAYLCPVVDWTDADVWEYLNSRNIPHCSIYDEGEKRIGCVCCPLAQAKMEGDARRYPKTANMLLMGHRLYCERLKAQGWLLKNGKRHPIADYTPEESFAWWLKYGRLDMKTGEEDENENQPCLFSGTGFSESDGITEEE